MNEVKTPKKPLIYYYLLAMLALLLLNTFLFPLINMFILLLYNKASVLFTFFYNF